MYAGIAKPIVFTSRTAAPVKEAPLIRQASNASNKAAIATGLDPALASIRELTANEKKMLVWTKISKTLKKKNLIRPIKSPKGIINAVNRILGQIFIQPSKFGSHIMY